MKTNTFGSPGRFSMSLVLSAAIFVVLAVPASCLSQTSPATENGTEKHSATYSVDQVPKEVGSCTEYKKQLSKDKELIALLQEQNRRLKAENEKLKAGK